MSTPGPSNLNQKSILGDFDNVWHKCPHNGSKNVQPRPLDNPTNGLLWSRRIVEARDLHTSERVLDRDRLSTTDHSENSKIESCTARYSI